MPVPSALAAALADRYRLERELGAGGMATVYLAHDVKHDRRVAVKVLKPELAAVLGAERFVVEIKTTAALQHPHILPLFDSGEADGFLYYVMPFIDGETLRAKLDRETQLGVDEAVKIATDVADALQHAHEQGVIHRDIKPENILLAKGRPMVADFGIALAVSAAAGGRMTETGLSLGTPHYMSPEQATAEKEISARSDVYSLASVCYEMLAGQPPHLGGSAQAIIMKIIAEPVQPVTALRRSVPPNVAAALAQALEKVPADRFASARAFAAALANPAFTGRIGHGAVAPAGVSSAPRRATMVGLALGMLAVGAALGIGFMPTPPPADRVVRFRAAPPEGMELPLLANGFAISPDGQWIAIVAHPGRDGENGIHLRRVDRLETELVKGTEGGTTPYFSPDGRTLGFVASDGRLRRVDITGGAVTTISDRPAGDRSTPDWGADGRIYFRGDDYRLYQVSAGGGTSQQLGEDITIPTAQGELPAAYSFPQALPGGGRLLVSQCVAGNLRGNGSCLGRLVIMDVASGRVTPVDVAGSRGWYVEGYLVLLDARALSAVPFDLESSTAIGEPVTLIDGLGPGAHVSLSASGSLVYLGRDAVRERVIVELDRSGREEVIVATPGPYFWSRLSPDGTRVLMVADGAQAQSNRVVIYDRRSGTIARMTAAGTHQRPSWSPDGRRIAFSSTRDSVTGVWVAPADGSTPAAPVAAGQDVVQHTATSWTPDGEFIIIDGLADSAPNAGADDIYALPVNGAGGLRSVVATPASEQVGEVSPDGRWIAYVSDDAGFPQVYIQPFLRPGGRTLVSLGSAIEPAWGALDELLYTSLTTDSLVSARLTYGDAVTVTRTALLRRSRFVEGTNAWREYDVSADGQRFLFARGVADATPREPIVVVNWLSEIRAAIAAQRAAP